MKTVAVSVISAFIRILSKQLIASDKVKDEFVFFLNLKVLTLLQDGSLCDYITCNNYAILHSLVLYSGSSLGANSKPLNIP